MIARISPRKLRGAVAAIPSKSEAHRALICAALADGPTNIRMGESSEDIEATIRCLTAFGAKIERTDSGLRVEPIAEVPASCDADCGESGSTLRFLLPVAAALGIDARFHMRGRLPERPIAPLDRELVCGGCELTRPERDVLRIHGKLRPGEYELPGDVSSQYISGMLFALPLLDGESRLAVTGRRESVDYVAMTLQTLARFGVAPELRGDSYIIGSDSRYTSPGEAAVGGDWSNAAFWLCANALPGCEVTVTGLDANSAQGDRRAAEELRRMEAGETTLDAADIPDLVPALAATACARNQALRVIRAERLRIKESDRLASVSRTLRALGGDVRETEDGLTVSPLSPAGGAPSEGDLRPYTEPTHTCDADAYWPGFAEESTSAVLTGGAVDSCGDHRIAMMAAIASCACAGEVVVRGAEAVNKSYPGFWRDFAALGGCVELTED